MTAGHGEKLSRTQERAIAALLAQPTIVKAASAAGVGERTLRRWLKDTGFRIAYDTARREIVDHAVARLQATAGEAVDTLQAVMRTGTKDGDRLRASIAVLDRAATEPGEPLRVDVTTGGEPLLNTVDGRRSALLALLAQLKSQAAGGSGSAAAATTASNLPH
jgi:hypothetical protein